MADLSQMSWHLDDRVQPIQLRYEPSSATTSQGTIAKTSKHDKQPTAPPRPPVARKVCLRKIYSKITPRIRILYISQEL
ncbi:unnamed protein product [Gongylonema pulchrum]|uniref:Uncharacterized protein n=1 Tax=Gongylonema pulchrum TaxID=637853 RepID=A0A183DMR9_9BILA|nr:unnamed protein product [Gongylonema pulchrum]